MIAAQVDFPAIELRLPYRAPYDVRAMTDFLAAHVVRGLEEMALDASGFVYRRSVRLSEGLATGTGVELQGWIQLRFDAANQAVNAQVAESLAPALPMVKSQLRAMLDLDCDPQAIDAALLPDFPGTTGMRVPGAMDGFELAVRAILGQQITVVAAHTIAGRLVDRLGAPCATPFPAVQRLFPIPQAFVEADSDTLGSLGVVRQRQSAIWAVAKAVLDGSVRLEAGVPPEPTMAALRAMPGIGDWTAQYIAMRALRWPDASLAGDVALQKVLGVARDSSPAKAARATANIMQTWQPWRSYGVVRAWSRLSAAKGSALPL